MLRRPDSHKLTPEQAPTLLLEAINRVRPSIGEGVRTGTRLFKSITALTIACMIAGCKPGPNPRSTIDTPHVDCDHQKTAVGIYTCCARLALGSYSASFSESDIHRFEASAGIDVAGAGGNLKTIRDVDKSLAVSLSGAPAFLGDVRKDCFELAMSGSISLPGDKVTVKPCEIPIVWTNVTAGYSKDDYECSFPPGTRVRAVFEGVPEITSSTDNKIWNAAIEMTLQPKGVPCSASECKDTHGVPFGTAPDKWSQFRMVSEADAPKSGIIVWDLKLGMCQTGPHQGNCSLRSGAKLRVEPIQ